MAALVTAGRIAGFKWRPGKNAGYRAGRCLMWGGTRHLTVGRYSGDSSVGLNGVFQSYVPRSMPYEQYAEINAVCYHNCEWNQELSGCEVEWLPGERFTAHQINGCGLWVAAMVQSGVPFVDLRRAGTLRFKVGEVIRGFVDHGDLQHKACDQHTDGWEIEWPAIAAAATRYLGGMVPSPPDEGDDDLTPEQADQLGAIFLSVVGDDNPIWNAPKKNSIAKRVGDIWANIRGVPELGVPSMAKQVTELTGRQVTPVDVAALAKALAPALSAELGKPITEAQVEAACNRAVAGSPVTLTGTLG